MFSDYEGKRVVVTGCSSGIGEATAVALVAAGAEVIGMSRRAPTIEIADFCVLDLTSVDSIESAAASIPGPVDALFNCAGAPPVLPSLDIVKVNFLGQRLLTERIIEGMPCGSSIASVSSSNANGWRKNVDILAEFVATETFDLGVSWYEGHADVAGHGYPFSKEALTFWTLEQASRVAPSGIRINCISPGAVQTPLLDVAQQAFPPELLAATLHPSGRPAQIQEQVSPLLFLNSHGASYINGADLAVDGGFSAALASAGASTST